MATPTVSAENVVVDEGAGYAEFLVRLSGPSTETVSVGYQTSPGSANVLDYNSVYSGLGFAPGETVKTVRVGLTDDTVMEGNETFYLNLFKPANASASTVVGTGTVTATILDNDGAAGIPVLRVSSPVVDETSGVAVFMLSLDRLSTSRVSVNYVTEAGTAGTADFAATVGSAVFAPGERVKTVRVPVIDDGLAEGNEQFNLVLSNPAGAFVPDLRGTASIRPSDQPIVATPTVSAENIIVDEGSGYAEFLVRLSGPSTETVPVGYQTSPGSANVLDYNSVYSGLGFAPGETVKTVRVGLTDDTQREGNETFYLEFFKPASGSAAIIGTGTVTATILDNDTAPPSINIPPLVAASTSERKLSVGAVAEADAWWTASDPNGDAISWWAVYDNNPVGSSASFSLVGNVWSYEQNSSINGLSIPARERIAVTAQQFADLSVQAGSAAATDSLYAIAWDGQTWGNWSEIVLTTILKRAAPADLDGDALFDSAYYYSVNPDVAAAGMDATAHYRSFGWREGRDPSLYFDADRYLAHNRDVFAAGVNPLEHYREWGWREGRDPSAYFDSDWYLTRNPDVAAAGINPLTHYMQNGWQEGRYPSVYFNTDFYLNTYPDVAAANVEPLGHYLQWGWREGRGTDWFDTDWYLMRNPDVAAAGVNPLQHYLDAGWREGRDPHPAFDTGAYLTFNPDVAAAGVDPLGHYLMYGDAEGREAISVDSWQI